MIVSAFVQVLLPVIVVLACGYALWPVFPLDLRSLNRVSMYVLSLALIFMTLARTQVGGAEALRIAAVSALFCLAIGALTLVCAAPLRADRAALSGLLLCTQSENQSSAPSGASRPF
jgi:malate permease and related proteins